MLTCRFLSLAVIGLVVALTPLGPAEAAPKKVAPVLNFTMNDIDGKPVHLSKFQGDVLMMVKVASNCENPPQYAGLQKLYEQYKKKGLTILAFPANEFGQQEPGTNREIK